MEQNATLPAALNLAPSIKKPNKKKKQQLNSGQQDAPASRPSPPSEMVEVDEEENIESSEIGGGEKTVPNPLVVTNRRPAATNGRGGQHRAKDNLGEDAEGGGSDAARLLDELEKERKRSQELEWLLESLRNASDEKSRAFETIVSARQEELEKEKARSQELGEIVQDLKAQLSGKSTKGTIAQDKLQEQKSHIEELEEQLSTQRNEAAELRQLLKEECESRERDRTEANQRLVQVQEAKQQLDTQYKALLGRVAHIKTTLSDKLKSDAEELDRTRNMVDNLEEDNRGLNQTINELEVKLEKANQEGDRASKELSTLRSRLNLSQQNWAKERNDLISAQKLTSEDYEAARQAMQEWEIIATEERSVRESLGDRVIELEEQLANQQASYDKVLAERDRESNTVDGLQRALKDIQNARKQELREVVEGMEIQINQLKSKGQALEKRANEAEVQLSSIRQDLERVLPFEKEVKEKNLLIGKLRHEAVTLNDHLRKALRMLKRDNADDKIDKQLVTNVLLQFVSIQRGDSKKYEILQLIASVLDWNDEQREKAGLVRPGTAANSQNTFLKTPPLSPFHRSPSTPSLSDAYEGSRDLWTSVLDSEKS